MTIWVWNELTGLTQNWHSEAGVVIEADSWSRAIQLLRENAPSFFCISDEQLAAPDHVFHPGVYSDKETVIIFPNAGCC